MKLKFLSLLLIIVSGVEAISSEDSNINFNSEDKTLIKGNQQSHDSTRLNRDVVIMESKNEHGHELSVTIRKGGGGGGGRGGGGRGGRGGKGGGGGSGRGRGRVVGGGAAAGIIGAGIIGGSVYHGNHHSNNSATSLSTGPHLSVSAFILCLSFWI